MGLSLSPQTVQMLYGLYTQDKLEINRRYQRKLVWSISEKESFIDSLINGYPIPLILASRNQQDNFEILDGLQRLNAIVSFIEGDFSVNGEYFDFNAITYTKQLNTLKTQKEPILSNDKISNLLNYPIPFGITDYYENEFIDETFRRINTRGKQLSKQDVRQAGATGKIPDIINKIAMYVRKDSSQSEIISLKNMKNISIGESELGYIDINKIFWVENGIITKDDIKKSRDEELIAHLLSYVLAPNISETASFYLDKLYESSEESMELINEINKIGQHEIIRSFNDVFDEIGKIFNNKRDNFAKTVYSGTEKNIKSANAFQIIFLSIYELMIKEGKKINNHKEIHQSLKGIYTTIYSATLSSDKKWKNQDRKSLINATKGIIKNHFYDSGKYNPGVWIKNLENIINESKVEQSYFDFKMGFLNINDFTFNTELVNKVVMTLSAMVNTQNNVECMILVGIADNEIDAKKHSKTYSKDYVKYNHKYIVGIEDEARKLYPKDPLDNYLKKVKRCIQENQYISNEFKEKILQNMVTFTYKEKEILLFKIRKGEKPEFYDGKIYVRHISDNHELPVKEVIAGTPEFIKLIQDFK